MTRGETYYELFGVRPDATPQQIRASYLRLLKQHHPDKATKAEAAGRPELVPLINRGYSVLRDPQKRAEYDAQLRSLIPTGPTALSGPAEVALGGSRGRRTAMIVFAGACFVLGGFIAQFASSTPGKSIADSFDWLVPQYHPVKSIRVSSAQPEDLRREAHVARSVSDGRAEYLSRRCFATARQDGDLATAELCVVFDQSVIFWRRGPGKITFLPIYFNDNVAEIRDVAALNASGEGDAYKAFQNLREEAFHALLVDVTGSNETIARGAADTRNIDRRSDRPVQGNAGSM